MRTLILAIFVGLPVFLRAGTFDVSASVDRTDLELGESLHLTLQVAIQGTLAFPPQMEQPKFEGFEARGPQQMQNVSWVNGAVSIQQSLAWELTAQKAGDLVLGPYEIHAKDALNGEIRKATKAIHITVRRPKNLGFKALNQAQPQAGGTPEGAVGPDAEVLRDIKPDRPFPWLLAGLWGAGALALLALLLTWWRRRPPAPTEPPPPRDPAQWALEQLEKLRQGLQPGGEAAFVVASARLLRDYLRHRLALGFESTLSEGLRVLRRRAAGLDDSRETGLRLDRLLYADVPVEPADADWAYEALRALIIGAERVLPRLQAPPPPAGKRPSAPSRKTQNPKPKPRGSHGK